MDKFELSGKEKHRHEGLITEKTRNISKDLIEVIKKHKPTYAEAYMSLEVTYNKLQYESNFVNIG